MKRKSIFWGLSLIAIAIFVVVYQMGIISSEISVWSVVLGILFGYFFMDFVFGLIDFGTVSDINWWSYIITPIITLFFCFLSTLLLKNKIVKTDMNASLKSIE